MTFAVWFYLNCFLFFAPTFLFPFALNKYFSVLHLNLSMAFLKQYLIFSCVCSRDFNIHTRCLELIPKYFK